MRQVGEHDMFLDKTSVVCSQIEKQRSYLDVGNRSEVFISSKQSVRELIRSRVNARKQEIAKELISSELNYYTITFLTLSNSVVACFPFHPFTLQLLTWTFIGVTWRLLDPFAITVSSSVRRCWVATEAVSGFSPSSTHSRTLCPFRPCAPLAITNLFC